MKEVYVFYGCHGSGKTYVSKKFAEEISGEYICTDFAESSKFSSDKLSDENLDFQEMYFQTLQQTYEKILSMTDFQKVPLVIDFGFYQEVPYIRYFNHKTLIKKIPLIYEYEENLDKKFKVTRYLVYAPLDVIRQRIISRVKVLQRNVEWELQSLNHIYTNFMKLYKTLKHKFTLWDNS